MKETRLYFDSGGEKRDREIMGERESERDPAVF